MFLSLWTFGLVKEEVPCGSQASDGAGNLDDVHSSNGKFFFACWELFWALPLLLVQPVLPASSTFSVDRTSWFVDKASVHKKVWGSGL